MEKSFASQSSDNDLRGGNDESALIRGILHESVEGTKLRLQHELSLKVQITHADFAASEFDLTKPSSICCHYGGPLQAAGLGGYVALIRLLVEHGADLNVQGCVYGTALYVAVLVLLLLGGSGHFTEETKGTATEKTKKATTEQTKELAIDEMEKTASEEPKDTNIQEIWETATKETKELVAEETEETVTEHLRVAVTEGPKESPIEGTETASAKEKKETATEEARETTTDGGSPDDKDTVRCEEGLVESDVGGL